MYDKIHYNKKIIIIKKKINFALSLSKKKWSSDEVTSWELLDVSAHPALVGKD